MSQAELTYDPQAVAAGLVPLLREYAQRLVEIGTTARRIQRLHGKARLGKQQLAAEAKRVGLAAPKRGHTQLEEQELAAQRAQADFDSLRFAFHRLLPSSTDLSRQASQLVEHGKLEPVTRIELSLRLADFEAALRRAQQRIDAGLIG